MSYAADVLIREREQIALKLEALSDEVRSLRGRLRELDEAIGQLSGHAATASSQTSSSTGARAGRGMRLIDRVETMLPTSGDGTSPSEIAALLKEQGRDTSGETVASLLSRLRKEGKAMKSGRAWFRSPPLAGASDKPTTPSPSLPYVDETDAEDDAATSSPAVSPT